ncbi:MAG: transcription elongation factor GreA, partial [Parcubacteria group bacterium CG23_combo_of_CG06-09_8_20_14_all_35_6]
MNEFTPEGLEKLKKELEFLKTTKRQEIAESLKHAIAFGDLKENASYHEAKEAQGFMEGKIMELERILKSAKI